MNQKATPPLRIKSTDDLKNVAYIYRDRKGDWRCALANGIPASFWYAGISNDEMGFKFALEDAGNDITKILDLCRKRGSKRYQYEVA